MLQQTLLPVYIVPCDKLFDYMLYAEKHAAAQVSVLGWLTEVECVIFALRYWNKCEQTGETVNIESFYCLPANTASLFTCIRSHHPQSRRITYCISLGGSDILIMCKIMDSW